MPYLLAFPSLLIAIILQTVVLSRLPWMQGTADLVMLVVLAWALQDRVRSAWFWSLLAGLAINLISATPFSAYIFSYIIISGIAGLFQRRAWQNPVLAMYLTAFLGSFIVSGINYLALVINGTPLNILDSLSLVVLPGIIWNMVLALPVFSVISDLAEWAHPMEIKV